ncbi:MAG: hypothetical protein ACRBF0_17765 [Calditrichia bacterium]
MRYLIPSLICLIVSLSFLHAGDEEIKPGKEYKNKTEVPRFIVATISPGETFKNSTDRSFHVLSEETLREMDTHLALQKKIEMANQTMDLHKTTLDSLEERLKKIAEEMAELDASN